ncbi:carboxyl transferase domain-containing protein [Eubacterium sp. AB3007]|uniref:carboxyl transferase domain-containing protein n=1 Tax=Eubacterium sp. AB3007 TaxID=1392487 RepID=UPI0005591A17|nr:carboxyl transferase domain-containing protein [Eubacterium sp. AB3007]
MEIKNIGKRTTAYKRILDILDKGSFMEIGEHAAARHTNFYQPGTVEESDGVITGYGTILGVLVYIYSQDSEVMGGTFGEVHGKKIRRLYEHALKSQAPIIGLLDCQGFRIEEGLDGMNEFSKLYAMQAKASGKIPQIISVVGRCGGGMSVSAIMADFIFIEKEHGNIFVNPERLLENVIADGDYISAFDDGRYEWTDIVKNIRHLIDILPPSTEYSPLRNEQITDDPNRLCAGLTAGSGDARKILKEIADDHYFLECQPDKGPDMVCGFIRINGSTIGVVATNEVNGEKRMSSVGCDKAAALIEIAGKFNIPILTVIDTEGYHTTTENEKYLAGAASRMVKALCTTDVPRINLITGNVFGSAYSMLNSKGTGADYVFMWHGANVGIINPEQATEMIYGEYSEEKVAEYRDTYSSAIALARSGLVDKVIQPEETRKYLAGAFETFVNSR